MLRRWPDLLLAAAAVVAVAASLWHLEGATQGLRITETRVAKTPDTVFHPNADDPAPAVVIAHGFAGSQQIMQPFAVTLARNGYRSVTFDFPGHGASPTPLAVGLDRGGQMDLLALAVGEVGLAEAGKRH